MRTLIVSHNGRSRTDLPHTAIAEVLRDPAATLWLDISDPAEEDVALLREQFGFHPLAIEDAVRAHERPKVDAYGAPGDDDGDGVPDDLAPSEPLALSGLAAGSANDAPHNIATEVAPLADADQGGDELSEAMLLPLEPTPAAAVGAAGVGYYFVVFYAAAYNKTADHIETHAVNLFIGANYLVTVHAGVVQDIADTMARWRAPRSPLGSRVSALVHALLDAMVDDYFPLMDQVADRIEELEDTIFVNFDERSIEVMFRLKKDLLAMRRIVAPERDVLNVLLRRQLPIFGPEDIAYLQDVYDHIVRVTDNIDTYRDLLSSALDSYLSLQSNKLNQIMKLLTIASILLMSAALVTGFYGQNFRAFPELDWGIGSAWSLILMALITAGLMVYFKVKRWL